MENEIYKIPSELLMKMEQVRTFLERGRAAVMIGAGFSKNAQTSEFATMKDWNELTQLMYDQLFVNDNDQHLHLLSEPLKLAQMYEATFGRSALDTLIQNALPDASTFPGALHMLLMRMGWKDVFTTNYDTLLERASLESERAYTVVTNRETLLYSDSPRIVKLHGSFPNIRPYIITEEDFRTYPIMFPEFVNTVRQALMENLFCLVGFSGDDPNFLQWIGWLRDVMHGEQMPLYLVTYDKYMHEAQYKLLARRGIEIINLAKISGVGYAEGIKIFLDYVGADRMSEWNGKISLLGLDKRELLLKATERMREIREGCPNWLYMPGEYYRHFNELNHDCRNVAPDALESLSETERLDFLYEVIWRFDISLTPIRVKWVWKEMKEVDCKDTPNENYIEKVINIKLVLMRMCRFFMEFSEYENTVRQLESLQEKMTTKQRNRFCYEQLLWHAAHMEYDAMRKLLDKWSVQNSDAQSVLWKVSMMVEVGRKNEARNLLNAAIQQLKQTILPRGTKDNTISGYLDAMNDLMDLILPERIGTHRDTDLSILKRDIISNLRVAQDKPTEYLETMHEFRIGRSTNTWHSNTNDSESIMYAYRYMMLQERVGYPLGMDRFAVNEKWLQQCLQPLMGRLPIYVVGQLVRGNSVKTTKVCCQRDRIYNIPVETADTIYKIYEPALENYLKQPDERAFNQRIENIIIPVLCHLSTRMSQTSVSALQTRMLQMYEKRLKAFDNKHYLLLQENLFAVGKVNANREGLLSHIEDISSFDMEITATWMQQTEVSDKAIDIIEEALHRPDGLNRESAMIRLWQVWEQPCSSLQKKRMQALIHEWRNGENDKRLRNMLMASYIKLPFDKRMDKRSEIEHAQIIVDEILSMNLASIRGTIMTDLADDLRVLRYPAGKMTMQQNKQILSKVYDFLEKHKETLKEDDSETIFGGLRRECNVVMGVLMNYLYRMRLKDVPSDLLVSLESLLIEYWQNDVATIACVSLLNEHTDMLTEEQWIDILDESLESDNYLMSWYALQGVILLKNKRVKRSLVSTMIQYASFAQTIRVPDYIRTISNMIKESTISKSDYQNRVAEMLNRIDNNVDSYSCDEETKVDIKYQAEYLAGIVASKWDDCVACSHWRERAQDSREFNDVRVGYDLGVLDVKGEKMTLEDCLLK